MTKLRARANHEDGWVLLTAILLMAIMLGTILSIATFVDGQTKLGASLRKRETAFNMAQAAMNMQAYSLSRDWPGFGQKDTPYPVCTPSTSVSRCPSPTEMSNLIASPDATGATWQTQVRDNDVTAPNFYSDSPPVRSRATTPTTTAPCGCAPQATAKGKTRTLVALVRAEQQYEDIPHATLLTRQLHAGQQRLQRQQAVLRQRQLGHRRRDAVRPVQRDADRRLRRLACPYSDSKYFPRRHPARDLALPLLHGHHAANAISSEPARAPIKTREVARATTSTSCPPALRAGTVVWIDSGSCGYTGGPASAQMLITQQRHIWT